MLQLAPPTGVIRMRDALMNTSSVHWVAECDEQCIIHSSVSLSKV